jgi:hypothetical protein
MPSAKMLLWMAGVSLVCIIGLERYRQRDAAAAAAAGRR